MEKAVHGVRIALLPSENAFLAKAGWSPGAVSICAEQLLFQEALRVPLQCSTRPMAGGSSSKQNCLRF